MSSIKNSFNFKKKAFIKIPKTSIVRVPDPAVCLTCGVCPGAQLPFLSLMYIVSLDLVKAYVKKSNIIEH